jgi:hypothetical protein
MHTLLSIQYIAKIGITLLFFRRPDDYIHKNNIFITSNADFQETNTAKR